MDLEVRSAVLADAAAIASVHVRVWRETYDGLMDPAFLAGLSEDRFTRNWTRQLADLGEQRMCVGVVDGTIVGWAVAGPARDDDPVVPQELHALNVLASAHGTGLGLALMEAVVSPSPCYLWVAQGNGRAIRFYEKHGFALDGVSHDDDRLGVVHLRMVRPS